MNCFSCFSSNEKKASKKCAGLKPGSRQASNSSTEALPKPRTQAQPQSSSQQLQPQPQPQPQTSQPSNNEAKTSDLSNDEQQGDKNIAAETFTFRELAIATRNFRKEYLLGEGGFGRVYKGKLEKTNQTVAIKQLDRNGLQGNREFLVEVLMLSLLHHEHLVNLIGYCADGEQRLLVYEYMSSGCLEDHLLGIPPGGSPLSWRTRMKIALHAAKGLEYLHDKANPPVIYRDLKSSNILLDDEYNAKLSDFGLAKLGPMGDKTHVTTRVMGTYGYCAPEYQKTGQLTMSSDVYSFGVVLLEIITGKRAIDARKRGEPVTLVSWAQPLLKDHSRFNELVDPHLRGDFPKKSLNQAVAVAAMCVNEDASSRPLISDVVTALSCLPEQDPGASFSGPLLSNRPSAMTKPQTHRSELITTKEREKAVAEAIAWGQRSRNNNGN